MKWISFMKEWDSDIDIERDLGFNKINIRSCCRGVRKTHKGFIWKYKT